MTLQAFCLFESFSAFYFLMSAFYSFSQERFKCDLMTKWSKPAFSEHAKQENLWLSEGTLCVTSDLRSPVCLVWHVFHPWPAEGGIDHNMFISGSGRTALFFFCISSSHRPPLKDYYYPMHVFFLTAHKFSRVFDRAVPPLSALIKTFWSLLEKWVILNSGFYNLWVFQKENSRPLTLR